MSNYWNGHAEGMSAGFHYADIASRRAQNQADNEIDGLRDCLNQWQGYADKLKAKLDRAEGETIATAAALRGERAVSEQLKNALAMFVPDHPFLEDPAILDGALATAAAAYANEHGFRYNPKTGGIIRTA